MIDSEKAGAEERAKEKLEPRSVDAYWLQRELNKFFKDPIVSPTLKCKFCSRGYNWWIVCVCVCVGESKEGR